MSFVIETIRRLHPERRPDPAGQILNQILQILPEHIQFRLKPHIKTARNTYLKVQGAHRFTQDNQPNDLDEAIVSLQLAKNLAIDTILHSNSTATDKAYLTDGTGNSTSGAIWGFLVTLGLQPDQELVPVKDVDGYLQATHNLAQEILTLAYSSKHTKINLTEGKIRLQLAQHFGWLLRARAGE